jgi:hypothetical protein
MFQAAAVWNVGAALASVAMGQSGPRAWLGFAPVGDPLGWHVAALCVALFGLAYLWISQDPPGHRDLIRLGLIGKPLVFAICLGHVLFGQAPPAAAVAGSGDLLFALLFWRYLRRHPAA